MQKEKISFLDNKTATALDSYIWVIQNIFRGQLCDTLFAHLMSRSETQQPVQL